MTTPRPAWRTPVDRSTLAAYLARLGVRGTPPPTMETLCALHRAHVELVPYEVTWIALGEPRTIDPLDSIGYLLAGRGGYCYHLNGAFGTLLDWLGFDVRWRVAGVQSSTDPLPTGATGTHLTLEVHGLPTEAWPSGTWLVDVGLGNGPFEPLPLVAGSHTQGPFTYRLRPSEAVPGGWRFDHYDGAAFPGMDFAPGVAAITDFLGKHQELSTSPDSGFVRVVAALRRDESGVDEQRGLLYKRTDSAGSRTTELGSASEWFTVMADIFRLPFTDLDAERRRALWARLAADHENFLAARAARREGAGAGRQ